MLDGGGGIGGVDLHNVVTALALGFQHLERVVVIAGGDDPIRHLMLNQLGCGKVAGIGEGDPVPERGHPVRPSGTGISAGQRRKLPVAGEVDLAERFIERQSDRRACRADMLEGGGGRQSGGGLQLPDQLPAVEGVEQVDITRAAISDGNRQLALLHKDARRLLVRVAAVFQFQFGSHHSFLLQSVITVDDTGLIGARLHIDEADKERYAVLGVEAVPDSVCEGIDIPLDRNLLRLSLKGGQRVSVTAVGVNEMSLPRDRLRIFKIVAADRIGISVRTLQNGEDIASTAPEMRGV